MEKFSFTGHNDLQGEQSLQFKETAFENSKSVLGSIDFYMELDWNFGPGTLDNLENLNYLDLYRYDYDSEPFPPSVLFSLQDLTFTFIGKGFYK